MSTFVDILQLLIVFLFFLSFFLSFFLFTNLYILSFLALSFHPIYSHNLPFFWSFSYLSGMLKISRFHQDDNDLTYSQVYRTYTPIIQNGRYATCSRNKDGGNTKTFSLGNPFARRTTWLVPKTTSATPISSRVFGAHSMTSILYKYAHLPTLTLFFTFSLTEANTLSPVWLPEKTLSHSHFN